MRFTNFHDLFVEELQDLYDAEQQVIQAMPSLIDTASAKELKDAFTHQLNQTIQNARSLENVCKELGVEMGGKTCVGMEGVLEESVELMQENEKSPILDAALIGAAQRVGHYKIAGYGCAATYAKEMKHTKALHLLIDILEEEKANDNKLTTLAKDFINKQAQKSSQKFA